MIFAAVPNDIFITLAPASTAEINGSSKSLIKSYFIGIIFALSATPCVKMDVLSAPITELTKVPCPAFCPSFGIVCVESQV